MKINPITICAHKRAEILCSSHQISKRLHCFAALCRFGPGQVDFLQSSCSGAVLLTCDQNRVDNTEMFLGLLSRAYTAKAFLLLIPPVRRLGRHKEFGEDRARTADPKLIKNIP